MIQAHEIIEDIIVDIVGVTGSIPVASTILSQHIASVEETALGRSIARVCGLAARGRARRGRMMRFP